MWSIWNTRFCHTLPRFFWVIWFKAVKLKVAAPKLDAEVPDLTGLDPETARDILAASGLNMKEYMVQNGPSNQIQSSQPAQGQKLRSGQTVTVTVAP